MMRSGNRGQTRRSPKDADDSVGEEVIYDKPRGGGGGGGGGISASDRFNPRVVGNAGPGPGGGKLKSVPYDVDDGNIFDPFDWNNNVDDGLNEFIADDDVYYDDYEEDYDDTLPTVYVDPKKQALLNDDVHQIPGSPWAKPAYRGVRSSRPTEPLAIAKYASTIAFGMTMGWVGFLFVSAVWNYSSIGRILVEVFLAILSFFGLFWNLYFCVSSICKCFIPKKAFQTNTKYCSIIPEAKNPNDEWLDVTIQIPVYKESLKDVLMPTLKSCMRSRNHYIAHTQGTVQCNIVVCDDGMMAFLKDNFAAAEMLWETICSTEGKIVKLSKLLQQVPRPSRRHLKGLKSHAIYEVFHRMLFYYHHQIGFCARSTHDRRGKFKKASNLNAHLRLAWGAEQLAAENLAAYGGGTTGSGSGDEDGSGNGGYTAEEEDMAFEEALIEVSHNGDGSRFVMFGNNISIGHLIIVNDADARMAQSVILKTVPEFLNDPKLGFTQHTTKTMDDQRGESFYINMLSVYTDALYQGHFLLSSILGCHPPLVGHSIFLRSDAIQQCGRLRTLRKTQRWLENIGLPFLSVDQVGSSNLQMASATEYWSECHVSEDFELMIHLYNLGFDGRYIAYPNCEFQEGITRTFDEEAGRHRKFALGGHELMFNPINSWVGQGIFSPLFKTFLTCDIPSYYKIFLTAYLFSYTSGGAYIMVFTMAAIARILDEFGEIGYIYAFNSAGVLALSMVVYYLVGYVTFLISMVRMYFANRQLLFPEYRNRNVLYLVYKMIRYSMFFQLLFYSVMGNYFFLGSMDHLLSKPGIVSATNKDSIKITRCVALGDVIRFNSGSWLIAFYTICLAYAVVIEPDGWDPTLMPTDLIYSILFAGPAVLMAVMAFIVPLILNPYVLGWPFNPPCCRSRLTAKDLNPDDEKLNPLDKHAPANGGGMVDLKTFMTTTKELDDEIVRIQNKPDVELGSLATNEFGSKYAMSLAGGPRRSLSRLPQYDEKKDDGGMGQFVSGAVNRHNPPPPQPRRGARRPEPQPSQGRQQQKQQQQQQTSRSRNSAPPPPSRERNAHRGNGGGGDGAKRSGGGNIGLAMI